MINATEGWAVGGPVLLRYRNGNWEEVTLPQDVPGFSTMSMLNAEEGWLISRSKGFVHYKNGQWDISDEPPVRIGLSAMQLLNENEGWAVGEGIFHYTNQ